MSPRGQKAIKNQPKIVSKSILKEESKRAPKKCSKNAQHGSKIGPIWGHGGLQNRLRLPSSEERTTPKDKTQKNTKKINPPRPATAPIPPDPAEWRADGDRFPRLAQLYISLRRYRLNKTTSAPEGALPVIRQPSLRPNGPPSTTLTSFAPLIEPRYR